MTVTIAVTGASGRMGHTILNLLSSHLEYTIAGACDIPNATAIGRDIGELLGQKPLGIRVQSDFTKMLDQKPNAIIDFTSPSASTGFAHIAASRKIPIVIGTTGLSVEQRDEIASCAREIPIILAPNMSIGVNVIFKLVADAAKLLGPDYDLEIVEAHHRLKKDAPSGTAVRIAEILAESTGRRYPNDVRFHREGIIGPRSDREIGMQVIRGGDIVGEHTVLYCGNGERLEISHIATSRETFANGAIRAARWCQGKAPGLYDMQDVLGLR